MKNLIIKKNGIEITEIKSFKLAKQDNSPYDNLEIVAELTSNLMSMVNGDTEKDIIEITFGKTRMIFKCKEFGASGVKVIGKTEEEPILFYNCYVSYEINTLQ